MSEILTKVNTSLTHYTIAFREVDGTVNGYNLINRDTGVVEATEESMPGIIYRAEYFDNILQNILEGDTKATPATVADDVILN